MKAKFVFCLALVLSGCVVNGQHGATALREQQRHYLCAYQINGPVFYANLNKQTGLKEKLAKSEAEQRKTSFSCFTGPVYQDCLEEALSEAGLKLQSPSQVYFNGLRGQIFIWGTKKECHAVRRVVEELNGGSVTIVLNHPVSEATP
jgi:hypothetical protein